MSPDFDAVYVVLLPDVVAAVAAVLTVEADLPETAVLAALTGRRASPDLDGV